MEKVSIFERPVWVSVLALTAAVSWGWAYPLIKLGFESLGITADMTGGKLLFAGVRFALAGAIVLALARVMGKDFALKRDGGGGGVWGGVAFVLAFSMLNTFLHYMCFYIGLSYSFGSRAAILNSLSVFVTVIAACVLFASDRFTLRKVVGCMVGFAGIVMLNLGGEGSGGFTWLGDGMIVMNALSGAGASLMTRGLGRRMDVFVGTGLSLLIGGVGLVGVGWCMGGVWPVFSWWAVVVLALLVAISALSFSIYNRLLMCNPVGRVAIYNSLIPVVGAVTSCLCLGEPFLWNYVTAAVLATVGIYLVNTRPRP